MSNPQQPQQQQQQQLELFSAAPVKRNLSQISFLRAVAAILSGIASGVIGYTHAHGLIFYVVVSAVISLVLYARYGKHCSGKGPASSQGAATYYPSVWNLVTDGIFGNLFTFVLFWTLFFGIVHVY